MNESSAFRWLLPLTALACVGRDETSVALEYDYGTLVAFRSAIPTEERLVASVPTAAADGTMAAASPAAVLAGQGVSFARGINQTVRDIARTLDAIVGQPPSDFAPEREEFLWGPWQAPSGPGEIRLRIRKNTGAATFEYSYSLARQLPGRPETSEVVLWGGGSPEADDRGSGLTVLDLDANAAFEAAHGGDPDVSDGQGRFALVHGHARRAADSVYFNLATYREYVAPTNVELAAREPVSVEHFYGRVAEPSGTVLDFLQSELDTDLCAESASSCFGVIPERSDAERFVFGEFFVDNGAGRAEVLLTGGDLSSEVQMTECWNASLARTSYQLRTDDLTMQMVPSAECPGRAAQSAQELGLPTPDDVQPSLLYALRCAVEPGAVGCD